jgi:hypothetical protein
MFRQASTIASEIASQSLSGCPALTDSEVKSAVMVHPAVQPYMGFRRAEYLTEVAFSYEMFATD